MRVCVRLAPIRGIAYSDTVAVNLLNVRALCPICASRKRCSVLFKRVLNFLLPIFEVALKELQGQACDQNAAPPACPPRFVLFFFGLTSSCSFAPTSVAERRGNSATREEEEHDQGGEAGHQGEEG